jgi:hypothetical protein
MPETHDVQQRDLGRSSVSYKKLFLTKKRRIGDKLKNLPKGAKIGITAGVVALAVVGSPAVVPVGLGLASLAGYYAVKKRKYSSAMTPERIKIYEQAIATLKDPKKLRLLADEFEKVGATKEAEHLRKRAALRERSPAEKKADQKRYREAMASTDIKKIESEAAYFESIAADGAAKNLRTRASALKAVS